MISNSYDVEEISQIVFIKVYKNLCSFRFDSKFSTWISTITYNETVIYLKKKYKERIINPVNKYAETDLIIDGEDQPDEALYKTERAVLLKDLTSKLKHPYNLILSLYHWQNMSYKEIGVILHMPEGTVKSYLFRGRKLLKEKMLKIYIPEEL